MKYRYGSTYTPGTRAQRTVRRFQDALLVLLSEKVWREITVIDVSRRVGTSPASVYQYFPHLDALALATAERLAQENVPLPQHLALVVALLRWESEGGPV